MENCKLLILGVGQYGAVVKEIAESTGMFACIDFLDDASSLAIGKLSDCAEFLQEYGFAVVAIGNPDVRKKWTQHLKNVGYQIPVLVHPRAVVMPSAELGEGTIVEANAVVNSNSVVSTGCLISAGAVINHNAVIGEFCHIDCNSVVPARGQMPPGTKLFCGKVLD